MIYDIARKYKENIPLIIRTYNKTNQLHKCDDGIKHTVTKIIIH